MQTYVLQSHLMTGTINLIKCHILLFVFPIYSKSIIITALCNTLHLSLIPITAYLCLLGDIFKAFYSTLDHISRNVDIALCNRCVCQI